MDQTTFVLHFSLFLMSTSELVAFTWQCGVSEETPDEMIFLCLSFTVSQSPRLSLSLYKCLCLHVSLCHALFLSVPFSVCFRALGGPCVCQSLSPLCLRVSHLFLSAFVCLSLWQFLDLSFCQFLSVCVCVWVCVYVCLAVCSTHSLSVCSGPCLIPTYFSWFSWLCSYFGFYSHYEGSAVSLVLWLFPTRRFGSPKSSVLTMPKNVEHSKCRVLKGAMVG